ncbi:hypothetical protein C9F11_45160 (plasmid) [Streptomyces sp. YIM 121038]|uniref:hypothetical protein n=1 Tax=Streptomyces sp. YIM 121038 TaxID=2136401 RepID=UPI00116455C6|nr:hypothetical protein [Streptomyces sp. YIM 121038]QCX82592.1 hypothetical protein C9F11_45160 [Streptomyces sp. YIM 121038]
MDSGYTSAAAIDTAAREHGVELVGPLPARGRSWQRKQQTGFAREDFVIDFDRRTVTRPQGKVTGRWAQAPAMAPLHRGPFPPDPLHSMPSAFLLHQRNLAPDRQLPPAASA